MWWTQTKLSQTLVLAYTRLSLEGREGRLWSTAKEEVRADKLDSGGKGGEGGVEEGRHQERDGVGEGRRGGGRRSVGLGHILGLETCGESLYIGGEEGGGVAFPRCRRGGPGVGRLGPL